MPCRLGGAFTELRVTVCSGYAIGQQALAAVMRAHDGRGPPTALEAAILRKLNLATAEDLIGYVRVVIDVCYYQVVNFLLRVACYILLT